MIWSWLEGVGGVGVEGCGKGMLNCMGFLFIGSMIAKVPFFARISSASC